MASGPGVLKDDDPRQGSQLARVGTIVVGDKQVSSFGQEKAAIRKKTGIERGCAGHWARFSCGKRNQP
jgi:hypothetical protein